MPEPLNPNSLICMHTDNSSITIGKPQQGQTFVLSKSTLASVLANLVAAACFYAISIFGGREKLLYSLYSSSNCDYWVVFLIPNRRFAN